MELERLKYTPSVMIDELLKKIKALLFLTGRLRRGDQRLRESQVSVWQHGSDGFQDG